MITNDICTICKDTLSGNFLDGDYVIYCQNAFCLECAQDYLITCDNCGEYTTYSRAIKLNGSLYCQHCDISLLGG
jgi:hypothetical protein